MTFKKMRKFASRGGFTLGKSHKERYLFVLKNNRTNAERHYSNLEEIRPDVEEIMECGTPFA